MQQVFTALGHLASEQPSIAGTTPALQRMYDEFGGEPDRVTLWGQIAAIYEGADTVDAAWVDREWAKMRGISVTASET
jgi:hypothetical protein